MKASVVTAYGDQEVMKYQDVRDPKRGAGDFPVRVAGIGINSENMLERNGDTKDRYCAAGCRFKSNDADVRADSRRSSRTDQAKNQTFTTTALKFGAVASWGESANRLSRLMWKIGKETVMEELTQQETGYSGRRSAKAFNRARHLA